MKRSRLSRGRKSHKSRLVIIRVHGSDIGVRDFGKHKISVMEYGRPDRKKDIIVHVFQSDILADKRYWFKLTKDGWTNTTLAGVKDGIVVPSSVWNEIKG